MTDKNIELRLGNSKMNKLETKIKNFVEKNNPGFKKMIYVGEYCRKYIDCSLNIKNNAKTKGRIKLEGENFKTNYKVGIKFNRVDIDRTYLFVGNMTHNSDGYIDNTIIDRLIEFNESLAKKLHIKEILADVMNGCGAKREIEAYEQRGYKIINGYFGTRGKILD